MNYLFLVLSLTLVAMNTANFATASDAKVNSVSSRMLAHTFRLKPGQDFMEELTTWAKDHKIKAAAIVSVVGSFTKVNLRYANQENGSTKEGHFEIVSVVGTFNATSAHLHASVSNEKGETFGGHLLPGNIVYTTAEVVVAELDDVVFSREKDDKAKGGSGWDELVIKRK